MPKYTLRWGILATGNIAQTFAKDLLVDPETRGVTEIQHELVAAASASGADRAKAFLGIVGAASTAKAYDNYQDLVEDPNVDIVYIATPHSHHYQNARLALEAGKNVLCEKAFTTNAAQLRVLVEIARRKKLFLMEAVWTRYFPLSIYVRRIITGKQIGTVHRVEADTSLATNPEEDFAETHRMVNPELAGGALLDLGIYSLTWIFQTLYTTQSKTERKAPEVYSIMTKCHTGVDESTTILLSFPRSNEAGGDAHGVATTSLRTGSDVDGKGTAGPAVRVAGDKGEVQVWFPTYRPTMTRLVLSDGSVEEKEWKQPGPGEGSGWYNGFGGDKNSEGEGHGMFWEADEAALAIRDGRREGQYEDLDESIVIMDVMDKVRKQNNLRYPDKIESTEYPLEF